MKIKDAASLILIDRRDEIPRLLMGRRSKKHVFMPDVFVFPGGRVDYSDRYAPFSKDYDKKTLLLLMEATNSRYSPLKARMLGLAAIREAYEEVGLLLAEKNNTPTRHKNESWHSFTSKGFAPNLAKLTFIARAITPPKNTRRFDTRFFIMQVDDYLKGQEATSSKELEDVQWLTFNQARSLPHHFITGEILNIAEKICQKGPLNQANLEVPLYRAKIGAQDKAKTVTLLGMDEVNKEKTIPLKSKI